jgi:hypothetical protein
MTMTEMVSLSEARVKRGQREFLVQVLRGGIMSPDSQAGRKDVMMDQHRSIDEVGISIPANEIAMMYLLAMELAVNIQIGQVDLATILHGIPATLYSSNILQLT